MLAQNKGIRILATGASFPDRVVSNSDLANRFPIHPEWVKNRIGISERRHMAAGETLREHIKKASLVSLKRAGIKARQIGAIIVATSTPDYINPSMASFLHEDLGCQESLFSTDVQSVCNGFSNALIVATSIMSNSEIQYALVVGADQFSKITKNDNKNAGFFGDGAGCVVLEKTGDNLDFFKFDTFTKSENWQGFSTINYELGFSMDARKVKEITEKNVPIAIKNFLAKSGIEINEIDYFISHQPSKPVLDQMQEFLGIDQERLPRTLNLYGNTTAASIPVTLDFLLSNKIFKEAKLLCLVSFGAGWTWTIAVTRLSIGSYNINL